MTTPAQQAHYEKVMNEINDDLTAMQLKYDSKYLSIALLNKATYLMQLIQAAKIWSEDEVSAIIQAALSDIHEKVKAPTVMTLGADGQATRAS